MPASLASAVPVGVRVCAAGQDRGLQSWADMSFELNGSALQCSQTPAIWKGPASAPPARLAVCGSPLQHTDGSGRAFRVFFSRAHPAGLTLPPLEPPMHASGKYGKILYQMLAHFLLNK